MFYLAILARVAASIEPLFVLSLIALAVSSLSSSSFSLSSTSVLSYPSFCKSSGEASAASDSSIVYIGSTPFASKTSRISSALEFKPSSSWSDKSFTIK